MPNRDYAIPLYSLPLPELYGLIQYERDRLGLTKEELRAIAMDYFGGEIPDPPKPYQLINFTYFLRKNYD